jgi:hypothetical protein
MVNIKNEKSIFCGLFIGSMGFFLEHEFAFLYIKLKLVLTDKNEKNECKNT